MVTTTKKTKIAGDPLDLNGRTYKQLSKLLDDMEAADRDETMTFPQRIAALIAVARVQKMFQDIRKSETYAGAGSAITKYAEAFGTPPNAISGRDQSPGRPPATLDISSDDDSDDDYDNAA